MNITSSEGFKTLTPFIWNSVAPLSIIVGLNGVGKSQLLQLMQEKYYNSANGGQPNHFFDDIAPLNKGLMVWHANHVPNDSFSYSGFYLLVNAIYQHCKENNSILGQRFDINDYVEQSVKDLKKEQDYELRNMISRYLHVVSNEKNNIWSEIILSSGKQSEDVSRGDIAMYFPINIFMRDRELALQGGIDLLFYVYQYKVVALAKSGIVSNDNNPAPWDILNEVIEASNLPYKIIKPDVKDFEEIFSNPFYKVESKPFKIRLQNRYTGSEVEMNDLSSGEKVLMSLALTLFQSQEIGTSKSIMLLDEPDAHLHPSMIKQFFKVVYELLVKKYNINVIMTTHSASTIALSPDASDCKIYELNKNPTIINEVSSKISIINTLSEGLVLVTPSTRYALVEGVDDKPFYEAVYRALSFTGELSSNTSVAFIPGTGKDSVNHWSHGLRNAGLNDIVKGIIDKDNNNAESVGIYRLSRYSIENYMLDPILVFCVSNRLPQSVPRFGFELGEEEKIKHFSNEQLQMICDSILEIIENSLPNKFLPLSDDDKKLNEIRFINGFTLLYPSWFLHKRGKDLFGVFYQQFGNLLDKRSLSQALKRTGFIPLELLEIIRAIQS